MIQRQLVAKMLTMMLTTVTTNNLIPKFKLANLIQTLKISTKIIVEKLLKRVMTLTIE